MKLMQFSGFSTMYTELSRLGVENATVCVPAQWRSSKYTKGQIKHVLSKISDFNPDAVFFLKDEYLTDLLPHIKKNFPKVKQIMWYGDQRGQQIIPLIKNRIPYLDALLITNDATEQLKMYRKAGIKHVYTYYHSFDPKEYQPTPTPITHQVFFGGGNFNPKKFPLSKFRNKLIHSINNRFRLLVHGGGWDFPTEARVLHDKYCSKIRKANINIGVNHYTVQRYYNRRLFESVASGRLHITHYVPGMEKHFTNKKHLVWFKTVDQALVLINHYLHNRDEREMIANVGRSFLLKNHAWNSRVIQFKKILENIL